MNTPELTNEELRVDRKFRPYYHCNALYMTHAFTKTVTNAFTMAKEQYAETALRYFWASQKIGQVKEHLSKFKDAWIDFAKQEEKKRLLENMNLGDTSLLRLFSVTDLANGVHAQFLTQTQATYAQEFNVAALEYAKLDQLCEEIEFTQDSGEFTQEESAIAKDAVLIADTYFGARAFYGRNSDEFQEVKCFVNETESYLHFEGIEPTDFSLTATTRRILARKENYFEHWDNASIHAVYPKDASAWLVSYVLKNMGAVENLSRVNV